MKQKILIVLMALVLPMMVSCGGDDNDDELPSVSSHIKIDGHWKCIAYKEGDVDMSPNGYYIFFSNKIYHTNMPCFNSKSGAFSLKGDNLIIHSKRYAVSEHSDKMSIFGVLTDGKRFVAKFEKQ